LMLYGAGVLKELDAMAGIEASTAERAEMDDEIESAVARIRSLGSSESPGYCPSCGERVQIGDLFCTHCGTSLKQQEASA
jgi:hypothetical protein